MSHARRRRTLRCSVLAASVAVIASLAVAPAAQAETPAPTGTEAAPTTSSAPTTADAPPTTTEAPAPTTTEAPAPTAADVPTEVPAPAPGTTAAPGEVTAGDTVVGELVQAYPDPEVDGHDHAHDDGPLSWIETPEGDAVRVPTEDLPDAAVGSTLAVTVGDEVVDEASAGQGLQPALEVQSASVLSAGTPDPTTAAAGVAVTNSITVVLVVPAGTTADGTTVSQVVDQLSGAVAGFWDEQSGGTIRLGAVAGATGWVSSTASCANPRGLWNTAAAAAQWSSGAGKHLMVYVPSTASGCAYGLGEIGSSVGTGGRSYVRAVATSVMAHELGHNFGLGHSSLSQCNSTVETGTCQLREYADYYDVMGFSWAQLGSLNVAQAARIGLLPTSEVVGITSASAPTTVSLVPVSAATGTRAIRLTDSRGAVYYVEYRQAGGRDAWLADRSVSRGLDVGVTVRRIAGDDFTSLLLDGTPSAQSSWNSDGRQALPVSSAVPVGAFGITVQSVSTQGAVVRVSPGGGDLAVDTAYAREGGQAGPLGYPVGSRYATPGGGVTQAFQFGRIHWSPGTGAFAVYGSISQAYDPMRGESGALGYPVGSRYATPGGGVTQAFQFGRIHWSPGTGAFAVYGSISQAYDSRRGESGVLGYPVAAVTTDVNGSLTQLFQSGRITITPSGALVEVR